MCSANTADPLTRAEFRNGCTSLLQGLTLLRRQGAVVEEEEDIDTLDRLGKIVLDLRSEIQSNREYRVDGPLVRFLTVQVFLGKSVIQEMKRTCGRGSSTVNGPEFVERHLRRHLSDLDAVIEELLPYHDNLIIHQQTSTKNGGDAGIQQRLKQEPMTKDTTLAPILKNGHKSSSGTSDRVHFGDINGVESGVKMTMPPMSHSDFAPEPISLRLPATHGAPSTAGKGPGVFEHMNEVQNIYAKHSPNWPAYENKPPLPRERTRPPLVYNGLRSMQNYTNLPQYTGVYLPMQAMPSGEYGHRAPHTQHWDHQNHVMY